MTRGEPIKVMFYIKNYFWNDTEVNRAVDMAIEALQVQKTGKWIIFPPFIEEICMCSNCKTKFKEAYQHRNICQKCGARMEKS